MGFRYKKSINFGGGFRINISKSGIGYSWGVKGYRITKTARGTTRTTTSIPGTGISYVHESGESKNHSSQYGTNPSPHPIPAVDNNHYDTQDIANSVATQMVSEGLEDMLASASRAIKLKRLTTIGFWITLVFGIAYPILLIVPAIFAALFFFVKTKGMIDLDYDIEADQQSYVDSQIDPMIKITKCSKIWRIMQTSKVVDRKYSGGAGTTVKRTSCTASAKMPFPFRTSTKVAVFKAKKETLLFLPDKLFILQGSKVGALNYNDISSDFHTTRFIENETVPKDAQVVGQTWEYVNKTGGPDQRFKKNRQLPVCLYGELGLTSVSGLNTVFMYSNPDA